MFIHFPEFWVTGEAEGQEAGRGIDRPAAQFDGGETGV